MSTFGERLKKARENAGLTQVEVADALATITSNKVLSDYETGKSTPDPFALKDLAILYGVTSDYLLGISDERSIVAIGKNNFSGLSDKALNIIMSLIDLLKDN